MTNTEKNIIGEKQAWSDFNKRNWDHHMQISKPVFEEVLNNYPRTSTKKAMDDYSLKLVNTQNLRLLKPEDPEDLAKWQQQMDVNLITDHLMQTDFKEKLKISLPDPVAQRNLVNGIKGCYDTYPVLAMYLVPGAHVSDLSEPEDRRCSVGGVTWIYKAKENGAEIVGAEFENGSLCVPEELDGIPVKTIAIGAFYRRPELTGVRISASVEKIWPGAFGWCENLQTIEAAEENPAYCSADGVLYTKDKSVLVACPGAVRKVSVDPAVKQIGWWAFAGCTKLESAALPEGLTDLGDHAFFDCYALQSIEIPESVLTIGESAFSDCHSLQGTVKLPAGLTKLGDSAFWNCTGLTEMVIPDGVSVLEGNVFELCTGLKSVKFPASLSKIDKTAFVFCQNLTELEIPEGVSFIGKAAFEYCTGLESVKLPSTLETIKIRAFANCSNLKAFTVDPRNEKFTAEDGILYSKDKKTLVAYPDGLAKGCVRLSEGVENIGEAAFKGNDQLTSVILPSTAKQMGLSAFWRCVNLREVVLNEGFEVLGSDAFMDCVSLKKLHLPDSLKQISDWTFWNCSALERLYLPKNVESVGLGTFLHCDSLTEIKVDPDNAFFKSVDGILYDKAGASLRACPNGKEKAVLPESVKRIGRYGLLGCRKLTEVRLNDGLESIDSWAFDGCRALQSLRIPESVNNLGDYLFYDCSSLKEIVLPQNTKRIGTCCFENTAFEELTLPAAVESVERYAFMDCKNLKQLTVPNPDAKYEREVFFRCSAMK